jgi:hypothetical protein
MSITADVSLVLYWNVHHAEYGSVRVDQRDVDRKLAVAVNEFLGAIERVDQPVTLPLATLSEARQAFFLGNDRNVGR